MPDKIRSIVVGMAGISRLMLSLLAEKPRHALVAVRWLSTGCFVPVAGDPL